jgi:hypothetical protein
MENSYHENSEKDVYLWIYYVSYWIIFIGHECFDPNPRNSLCL